MRRVLVLVTAWRDVRVQGEREIIRLTAAAALGRLVEGHGVNDLPRAAQGRVLALFHVMRFWFLCATHRPLPPTTAA